MQATLFSQLLPGDILLYSGNGIFSKGIEWKTADDVSHVEVYAGDGMSWASRDGIGVGYYELRTDGLKYLRRPNGEFKLLTARAWFQKVKGMTYGWGDIAANMNMTLPEVVPLEVNGWDCSHFASVLQEIAGCPQFDADYPKSKISPRDFKISRESKTISLAPVACETTRAT